MKKKAKCLQWIKKNKLEMVEREIPKLGTNEALLRVESCGICGSDIKILKHGNHRIKSGQIIGHEISGKIVKTNNVKDFSVGDRVSIGADIPCKKCDNCVNNKINKCSENLAIGHEFEGGFSQFMVLSSHLLRFGPIKKIDRLEYDLACMAEPLACCINGFEKVSFRTYDKVLIMGCGPIGLMLAFLAKKRGINTILISDISDKRLIMLKNFDFITAGVNSKQTNLNEWIKNKTKNTGVDLIFTANNSIDSHKEAIKILNPNTVVNFFGGLPSSSPNITIDTNEIHYKEAVLTGSHGSSPIQHSKAVDIIKKNKVFFKKLITKKTTITNYKEAFKLASSPNNLKVIINPNKTEHV